MPELPEVEASRTLLVEHCTGKQITAVIAVEGGGGPRTGSFDDVIHDDPGIDAGVLAQSLQGKTLSDVRRRGKQLWLVLSSPPHLLAHFGMTGSFVVRGVEPLKYQEFRVHNEEWPPRFAKLELGFEDGTSLAFCDPRRLGRLRLRSDPETEEPWCSLAPDPLTHPIDFASWDSFVASKGCTIKSLLLDQNGVVSVRRSSLDPSHRVAPRRDAFRASPLPVRQPRAEPGTVWCLQGIGNWVADEVLYQAKIHPEAVCRSLSKAQSACLHEAVMHVVNVACAANANAEHFPSDWLFHYRWGKGASGAKLPNGGSISFLTVGGRTSAVVLAEQKKGEGRAAEPGAGGEAAPKARRKGNGKASAAAREEQTVADEVTTATTTKSKAAKKRVGKASATSAEEEGEAAEGASKLANEGPPKRRRRSA